jgi:hypothetical protein
MLVAGLSKELLELDGSRMRVVGLQLPNLLLVLPGKLRLALMELRLYPASSLQQSVVAAF